MARRRQSISSGPVTITMDVPDLSGYGMRTKARKVYDDVLSIHRKRHLRYHTQATAPSRYAPEYQPWVKLTHHRGGEDPKAYYERLRAILKERAEQGIPPRESGRAGTDPDNVRPFYKSGRVQNVLLNNPARFSGKPHQRTLTIGAFPYYAKYQPNIWPAMQAVASDELAYLAKYAEKRWGEELRQQ